MEQEFETRTRAAQHAVKKAKDIVKQNNILVEEIHKTFGKEDHSVEFKLPKQDSTEEELIWMYKETDYKINTSSKLKNYFKDIINSMN